MARPKGSKDAQPRKRRSDAGKKVSATAKATARAATHGGNGINEEALLKAVSEIEKEHGKLSSLQGEYRNACRGPHMAIRRIEETARDSGVPTRPLRAELKRRELERRINKIPRELETDDAALLAQMRDRLGSLLDTPLGRAAVEDAARAAESRGKAAIGSIVGMVQPTAPPADDNDSDVRPRFNQLSDAEHQADLAASGGAPQQ